MIIGIDGSRAFLHQRTGIEEYSYQVIKGLTGEIPSNVRVRLYVQKKRVPVSVDFPLPANWEVEELWAPRFWTQGRLSLEMLLAPVGTLFIPAHTIPLIHPKNSIVVIHGLEYEINPDWYGFFEKLYMRISILFSVRVAKTIIAVSENTKKDLIRLYNVPKERIQVIHEGFAAVEKREQQSQKETIVFIGRLEARKNVERIIESFSLLKDKWQVPHKLLLIGRPGFGYQKIERMLASSTYKEEIHLLGFVTESEKTKLLAEAGVFIFPSLYEGFGLPILEAQAAGVPVITSNTSSLPEVAGAGALYVNPESVDDIAEKMYQAIIFLDEERSNLIQRGLENTKRFSWQKCAKDIAKTLSLKQPTQKFPRDA
jgi:glycosyltransferase involved in cell wall biosynthesis